jgi:flagellar basal body-associated protein FliL
MRDTFDVLSVKICDESDRNERFPNMKKSGFVIQIVLPVLLLSAMTTFAQQQTAAPAATQAPPAASAPAIPADAPHAADIQAARQVADSVAG